MSPVVLFFKMVSPQLLNPLHTEPTLHPSVCLLVDSESEPSPAFGGGGRGDREGREKDGFEEEDQNQERGGGKARALCRNSRTRGVLC